MNYLSICSGIEAASVGWQHLGWKALGFSEIESFPSAVLKHHYPEVPNLGDMTKHKDWSFDERIDLLVGGCPCQAFSVAGARRSLDDERGNLTLTFCNIADQFEPRFTLYENVPGILSTKDNAFGCLLAGLAGLDEALETEKGKWPGNGLVIGGRRRVAWVTLDAQFFGVPQRRRRVFVLAVDAQSVADSPNLCPSKILSIGTSMRRDTPPRRKAGEETSSSTGGGVESCYGIDEECNASDNHFGPLLRGGQGGTRQPVAFQQNTRDEVRLIGGEGLLPGALAAQAGMKQTNYIAEGYHTTGAGYWQEGSGTLRAREQDSHENLVTIMAHGQANAEIRSDGEPPSLTCNHEAPIVVHGAQDPCTSDIAFAQGRNNGGENVVAYSMITANTGANGLGLGFEINPTLDRAQPNAVAFQQNASGEIFTGALAGTVGTNPNASGRNTQMIFTGVGKTPFTVRRLTPEECEILMGFPVGYTDIKLKGKPTPDGPRYKALGNSMCTSVMRWVGGRIEMVRD